MRVHQVTVPRLRLPKTPRLPRPTGPRKLVGAYPSEADTPPLWWLGTIPEWWVYHWLKFVRDLVEGIDFRYLVGIGGPRRTLFGIEADFLVYAPGVTMVWRVQGYYWHFLRGEEEQARDRNEKLELQRQGYIVIDFIDTDLADTGQRNSILSQALDESIQYYTELTQ